MYEIMVALILKIAAEVGVPPNFALAIALTENEKLNPNAQSKPSANGTVDLGIMQLNSAYYGDIDWRDPETNIRAGCMHIKTLMQDRRLNTFWGVAVAYNCGIGRFFGSGPPIESTRYADRVMEKYKELAGWRTLEMLEGWKKIDRGMYRSYQLNMEDENA
jgi:soluble lytic murein transglycosylase-like protein